MKKNLSVIFSILLVLTLVFGALPMTVGAAASHSTTVNLQRADKNNTGAGYYFHNPSNTLTLSGLKIDTADEYGMKVKKDVTIILEGNNYIKAADIALFCPGTFTVKGSGTLTLVSEGRGIVINTNDTSDKFRLLEGTLEITSVGEAIYSKDAGAALAGGKVTLNVTDPAVDAISTRTLTLSGNVDFKANSSLNASYKLGITGANIDIASQRAALICGGKLVLEEMELKSNGADVALDAYADQTSLTSKSTFKRVQPSIIFGGSVPVAVDYVIMVAAVLAVAALIAVPILRHRARIKRLEEAGLAGNARKKKRSA